MLGWRDLRNRDRDQTSRLILGAQLHQKSIPMVALPSMVHNQGSWFCNRLFHRQSELPENIMMLFCFFANHHVTDSNVSGRLIRQSIPVAEHILFYEFNA